MTPDRPVGRAPVSRTPTPERAALAAAIDASWGELLAPLGGQPDGLNRSADSILAALEAAGYRLVPAAATGIDVPTLEKAVRYGVERNLGPGAVDMPIWHEVAAFASVEYARLPAADSGGGEAG